MSSESDEIVSFLRKLDNLIPDDQKFDLYLNEGAAILIAYDGTVATKDVDAIGRPEGLLRLLHEHAGKDSRVHVDTGLYLDVVAAGLFLSEHGWQGRAHPFGEANLERLRVYVLELHDLILSKVKRFNAKDQQDVEWLCYREELDIEILRERYRRARQLLDHDEKEKADVNFNHIETAFLGLRPTEL